MKITLLCVFPKLFCALHVSSIKFLTRKDTLTEVCIEFTDTDRGILRFINTWSKARFYDFPLRTRCFVTKCYIFKTHKACISEFTYFPTKMTGLTNWIYSNNNETNNKNNNLPFPSSWSEVTGIINWGGKIRKITGAKQ